MKKAYIAIQSLNSEWNNFIEHIKQHKPTEISLKQFNFDDINLSELPLPIQPWIHATSIDDNSADIAFEKKLCACVDSAKNRLIEAKNNGINWLLNESQFLNDCAEITQLCLVVIPLIRGYVDEQIAIDSKGAFAARNEIIEVSESVQSVLKEIKASSEAAAGHAKEADNAQTKLQSSQSALVEAEKKLNQATADLNKQGLADAFAAASDKFELQRKIFGAGFIIAIAGLLCVAINGKDALTSITTDFKFLGSLALATPLIWFGWLCARQLSQTTKIQQDYEYKKATALAFEAHKKEVADAKQENSELSTKLLNVVINNFGDNPVRLLINPKDEHGHPLESALASLTDKKVLDPLVKLSELFKKP